MSDRDFRRPIDHIVVEQHHASGVISDRGIRLYCTASANVHGGDDARYALQVFAPVKLADGREGKHHAVATASLSPRSTRD